MFTNLLTRVGTRQVQYYPAADTRSWRRQRRAQRLAVMSEAA